MSGQGNLHVMGWRGEDFAGAKLVLLVGDRLLTLLRDDRPDIPCPDMWDLPGGGREGVESPVDCVLRETEEEVGLCLSASDLVWTKRFHRAEALLPSWWFSARLPARAEDLIRFGNEGQRWELTDPTSWLADPQSIAYFKPRVQLGLAALAATNC